MKNICILGATGSIGTQTLDVIRSDSSNFKLMSISSNKNVNTTISIIKEFKPLYAAVTDIAAYNAINSFCRETNSKTEVLYGMEGLNKIVCQPEIDIVVTSVVGMIGLVPTINAIKSGKDIALANKETLVAGGSLVMKEVSLNNVKILPVDSEHGAVFQCLQGNSREDINNILLTASGGPFRGKTINDLMNISVEEALNHPKWNMGKKISIDSATLMNKGLEVIEAHWLFGVDYENIKVVVHPQSIIHSMVEYKDGSIIAELSDPDMKLPIQYALNYPKRKESVIKPLNFFETGNLSFEKPDMDTFKCLKLAYQAGKTGGTLPAILNAANEAAVELFLNKKIKFLDISRIIEECMLKFSYTHDFQIEDVILLDRKVKEYIINNYK
ncbi:MAG: 1-deoxy-D-xylulose-5-phosphate reductoisomerase [Solirubrobacterales bacterium]